MRDLRADFFSGLDWYETLTAPTSGREKTAWYVAKGLEPWWFVQALNAALAFAVEHELVDVYRQRFAGIRPQELRTVVFPIWEIANELLAARYVERVFGWRFDQHEPVGRGTRRGDWQFVAPSGRTVFVEVKSIREAELGGGVYSLDFTPRVRSVLARAYQQLPADDRGVLVVLVGGLTLDAPIENPMVGFLFGALFGRFQVTFQVLPYEAKTVRAGPSFRDMLVQPKKHRRLGCVAALRPGGMVEPDFGFYAIHNPFAYSEVRLSPDDLPNTLQFVVDGDGQGTFSGQADAAVIWENMRPGDDEG